MGFVASLGQTFCFGLAGWFGTPGQCCGSLVSSAGSRPDWLPARAAFGPHAIAALRWMSRPARQVWSRATTRAPGKSTRTVQNRSGDGTCGSRRVARVRRCRLCVLDDDMRLGRTPSLAVLKALFLLVRHHLGPLARDPYFADQYQDILKPLSAIILGALKRPNGRQRTTATLSQYPKHEIAHIVCEPHSFRILMGRPIQGSILMARTQSAKEGMRPKSSRTCCSPIQRVGIILPAEFVTVGPNS